MGCTSCERKSGVQECGCGRKFMGSADVCGHCASDKAAKKVDTVAKVEDTDGKKKIET